MHAVIIVIGIGWVVFWLGWLAAALTAKSSRGRFGQYTGARIAVGVVIYLVIRFGLFHGHVHASSITIDPVLSGVGLALWVAGLGLAIWARLYIGRNWGMPMTRRENPDLVTTGPYRFVRHPIYTGIIAALVGTALATSLYVLIVVALITAYFIFSATREEKFLGQEFPDSYPAYKARTKMLVPFVF
jgi:protein-S-isoprenylcysteine O-methyltransferase Ste14